MSTSMLHKSYSQGFKKSLFLCSLTPRPANGGNTWEGNSHCEETHQLESNIFATGGGKMGKYTSCKLFQCAKSAKVKVLMWKIKKVHDDQHRILVSAQPFSVLLRSVGLFKPREAFFKNSHTQRSVTIKILDSKEVEFLRVSLLAVLNHTCTKSNASH